MFIQTILSFLMIMLMMVFPGLLHPLSMGLIILLLTILMSVSMGFFMGSFWLPYILILVFMGGLLVIFIYVCLLAPNELFFSGNKFKYVVGGGVASITTILLNMNVLSTSTNMLLVPFELENFEWLHSFYSRELGGVTIFFVFYLLLTLVVVVNILKNNYSSLRA